MNGFPVDGFMTFSVINECLNLIKKVKTPETKLVTTSRTSKFKKV